MRSIRLALALVVILLLTITLLSCAGNPTAGRFQVVSGLVSYGDEQQHVILRIDTATGQTWFWNFRVNGWVSAGEGGLKPSP